MEISRSLSLILGKLKKEMPYLQARYQLETLGVFGSFVRGEQQSKSDLDMLVTFIDPPGLFKYIELENYLSAALGVKVDLVMKDALKPAIGKRILKDVQPV
jgi:uncharacterized protein